MNKTKPLYIIYMITNANNGVRYIGKTVEGLNKRWSRHLCSSNKPTTHFHRAIKKNGRDCWLKEILYVSFEKDDDHLYKIEEQLIADYDTFNNGYNSTKGGTGTGSGENNPVWGTTISPEHKAAIVAANTGKVVSEETRALIGKVHKGKKLSKEHIALMVKNLTGRVKTKIELERLSKSLMGNKNALGYKPTKEQKAKKLKSMIEHYKDPANRLKCCATRRKDGIRSNNKSGVKGVCWCKERNSWEVEIGVNHKKIRLGRYKNKNDAIIARWTAELEHDFAIIIY